jgi:hypothetical protein
MKQQYVICQYFPEEPLEVYGTFDTEAAARKYAERQGFALYNGTYTVHKVLDIKEEPE